MAEAAFPVIGRAAHHDQPSSAPASQPARPVTNHTRARGPDVARLILQLVAQNPGIRGDKLRNLITTPAPSTLRSSIILLVKAGQLVRHNGRLYAPHATELRDAQSASALNAVLRTEAAA